MNFKEGRLLWDLKRNLFVRSRPAILVKNSFLGFCAAAERRSKSFVEGICVPPCNAQSVSFGHKKNWQPTEFYCCFFLGRFSCSGGKYLGPGVRHLNPALFVASKIVHNFNFLVLRNWPNKTVVFG